jgi:hypothetical protein
MAGRCTYNRSIEGTDRSHHDSSWCPANASCGSATLGMQVPRVDIHTCGGGILASLHVGLGCLHPAAELHADHVQHVKCRKRDSNAASPDVSGRYDDSRQLRDSKMAGRSNAARLLLSGLLHLSTHRDIVAHCFDNPQLSPEQERVLLSRLDALGY